LTVRRTLALAACLALSACTAAPSPGPAPSATATSPSPVPSVSPAPKPIAFASKPLRRALSREDLRAVLLRLQTIADRSGGNRAVGTPGYSAAASFVAGALRRAGWRVSRPAFTMPVFVQDGPAVLEAPAGHALREGTDFRVALYSGAGDLTGPLREVGPGGAAGCRVADFGAFPGGGVALVTSGGCSTSTKVGNAQAAGAGALLIDRVDSLPGAPVRPATFSPAGIEIPILALTPDAADTVRAGGGEVRVTVRATTTDRTVASVIAETGPRTGPVVMLGGHLDSVLDGPGINDDGSGVAALVVLARALSRVRKPPRVRLGFWAGEEYGLFGSRAFVDGLDSAGVDEITGYVNVDMLGSRNGFRRVYSASGAPNGSQRIADALAAGLSVQGLGFGLETGNSGRSDHSSFDDDGIPVGGLFSGATELVTEADAAQTGATAGVPADRCYHQPCDRLAAVDLLLLEQMADALAHAVVVLSAAG
jgi:hypothetical protein